MVVSSVGEVIRSSENVVGKVPFLVLNNHVLYNCITEGSFTNKVGLFQYISMSAID